MAYININGGYIKQKQVKNENSVSMDDLNYGHTPTISTNARLVSLNGLTNGKIEIIEASDASTILGSPVTSGVFVAIKETLGGFNGNHVAVRLTEIYPLYGRVWINSYNNSWRGWQEFNPNSNKFLTSEVDTGMLWINNNRIYRKTVSFGSFTGPTALTAAHGISSITAVTSISGVAKSGTTYVALPRGHKDNVHDGISINVDGTNVALDVGGSNSFDSAIVTIEYTK